MMRPARGLLPGLCLTLLAISLLPGAADPPPSPPQATPAVMALIRRGLQAEADKRWDEALRLYQEALEDARAQRDRAGEAHALSVTGSLFSVTNRLKEALPHLEQALALWRQLKH